MNRLMYYYYLEVVERESLLNSNPDFLCFIVNENQAIADYLHYQSMAIEEGISIKSVLES